MPNTQPTATVQTAPNEDEHPRAHVLVVDDEESNRQLLQLTLSHEFDVTLSKSGADALEKLAHEHFDLLILDINMPGMDGFAVLRAVREKFEPVDLPVILMSGRSDASDIVQGLNFGASDYITKPITMNVALARVRTQVQMKHLSDDYKRTIQDLRLAQKMQERFYRIVSHDLKGPLTNLRMAHYLLRDQADGNEKLAAVLDSMDLSLNEMQDIIRIFLDVAAVQPGQIELDLNCVNPQDILKNIVNQYIVSAARKHIELDIIDGDKLLALADQRLLTQIVSNLVSNAIKYSPANTRTRLGVVRSGENTRIFVQDQGPGIPEAERGALFQMYSKLSTRPTAQESSTGLGLWIVKHLSNLMGGQVGVECPPEGGSIFWVELPFCDIETIIPA